MLVLDEDVIGVVTSNVGEISNKLFSFQCCFCIQYLLGNTEDKLHLPFQKRRGFTAYQLLDAYLLFCVREDILLLNQIRMGNWRYLLYLCFKGLYFNNIKNWFLSFLLIFPLFFDIYITFGNLC